MRHFWLRFESYFWDCSKCKCSKTFKITYIRIKAKRSSWNWLKTEEGYEWNSHKHQFKAACQRHQCIKNWVVLKSEEQSIGGFTNDNQWRYSIAMEEWNDVKV